MIFCFSPLKILCATVALIIVIVFDPSPQSNVASLCTGFTFFSNFTERCGASGKAAFSYHVKS